MGEFGQSIGGGDPIMEAMARRGMGAGTSSQQSPASAGFNPALQPPSPASSMGSPSMGTPAPQGMPSTGQPVGSGEGSLILKALDARLKSISKQEEGGVRQQGI